MKAITVTQPWAGLLVAGIKPIENRPRQIIALRSIPIRLAIHASREVDESAFDKIAEIDPGLRIAFDTKNWIDRLCRITSAVLGVARCYDVVDESSISRVVEEHQRWFFGKYGYLLDEAVTLKTPVLCRGMLGLWTLPGYVAADVEGQLA